MTQKTAESPINRASKQPNRMIKQTNYIDPMSGDVLRQTTKSVGSQFDANGYLFWNRKNNSRIFHDMPLPYDLTDSELGKITKLAHCLDPSSNMLVKRTNQGIRGMSADDVGKKLGLKERQQRTFLNKMIRLGVMAKARIITEGNRYIYYYMNPMYYHSSSRISVGLYLIFKEQLDKVLQPWVIGKFMEQAKAREEGEETNG